MCGIAAIVVYRGAGRVDRDELQKMREAMAQRGPDGAGLWCDADARAGLAHRRLAIIDPNERAAQPMSSADGRFVITFNGEIYNFRALREYLEAKGHHFRTESDTEVLLELYAAEGEAMVHRLRGMYAFALWDATRRGLFLARDPYGIKPLYYSDDGHSVRVASQVKALRAGGIISHQRDAAGLVGFLLFGSVPEPWTCFSAIKALPAGHVAWLDAGGLREPRRFASITDTLKEAADGATLTDDGREPLRAALLDSVRHHLVADVPVGAFLSSGIDSTTLVALMCESGYEEVRTVTMAFEPYLGAGQDEVPLAEMVAQRYRTQHTTSTVTASGFLDALPAILNAMDQPSIDGVNTWLVSRAAREVGLKVALSGLGGDELFGGYPSFKNVPQWVRLFKVPAAVPFLHEVVRRVVETIVPWVPVSPKASGMVKYGGTYAGAYFLRRGLFMPWELSGVLPREMAEAGLAQLDPVEYVGRSLVPEPRTPFGRVAAMEASLYLRNQLLRDADWASMAHGLEVRVPYVDYDLLRAVAPFVTTTSKVSKRLLAGAPSRPVPQRIVDRGKTGFSVPMAAWLEHPRSGFDVWRRVPALRAPHCHWSRRLAYVLAHHVLQERP